MVQGDADIAHLSPRAHVVVREGGVALPEQRGHDLRPIGLPALGLIEALAGNTEPLSEVTASLVPQLRLKPARIDALIDELRQRGLLRSGPAPAAPEPPTAPLATIEGPVVLPAPVLLRAVPGGFEWWDHEARHGVRLDAAELAAATVLTRAGDLDDAWARHHEDRKGAALTREAFDELVARLVGAGLAAPFDPDDPAHTIATRATAQRRAQRRRTAELLEQARAAHEATPRDPGQVAVVAVNDATNIPLSLGMLVAHARAHDDGALTRHYHFDPRMLFDEASLRGAAAQPGVFLFSNYVWCHGRNRMMSALIKETNPASVIVHGGPDTPKYDHDLGRYFADNPSIDVTVRGEGEQTVAEMLDALRSWDGDGPADLSVLADVPGLAFRTADGYHRSEDRDRIADIDQIPSPFLTGLFDHLSPAAPTALVPLETNRGCPYGCTFCDWGSATLSRIRKFDLDRVLAEIDWIADAQLPAIYIADANFGIFERDIEIAQHIAAKRRETGYPHVVGTNYAKNTTKHLSKIITIFTEAGILSEGKVSLQTWDAQTLKTIRRKNIKTEKYEDLAEEFEANDLPMQVELMMGLPGATVDSFRHDLQDAVDHDVRTNVYPTILLPNSPMNDPAYRDENAISVRPGDYVNATASFSEDDWERMDQLNHAFGLCDNAGMLRHIALYVRSETSQPEMAFIESLLDRTLADPEALPTLAFALDALPPLMVPPVSWTLLLDELRPFLVDEVGLADDTALDTVVAVQLAHLPARERSFPATVDLPHDYVAWHGLVQRARMGGHRDDWPEHVPALRTLGPGSITVDDPLHASAFASAGGGEFTRLTPWEFESPVARKVVTEQAEAG